MTTKQLITGALVLLLGGCTPIPPTAIDEPKMPSEAMESSSTVSSLMMKSEPSSQAKMAEDLPPQPDLNEMLIDALHMEYRSHARYQAVIDSLGPVSPFPLVDEQSEEKILALQTLLRAYDLPVGKNPYLGQIVAPERTVQGCRKGKEGELEAIAMYKTFLPLVSDYQDVYNVFTENLNISNETHLKLFNNCIKNESN